VSNTIGEKSIPSAWHFCFPLSFRKVTARPPKGLPVTGFGWTIVRSTARFRLPSHAFNRMSAGRLPFQAMSTSRSWRTRDWVRTWQKKDCVPRCLSQNPNFFHDMAWSPKTYTFPPHRGHGLPAQSAGSKGTPRCHLSSVE